MSRGADEARTAIQRVAREAYTRAFDAGAAFARSHTPVVRATDLVETMQAALSYIVAAEHLQEMAAEAVKSARAVLAQTMMDTGCPQVQSANQLCYLSRKPSFLSVSDETMIPRQYYVQPPPSLDRKAIMAALKAGELVPGCSMATPNDQTLNIRSRHKDAA